MSESRSTTGIRFTAYLYRLIMDHDRALAALRDSPLPWDFTVYLDGAPHRGSFYSDEERVALGMKSLAKPYLAVERKLK